jgi:hypothetical protein
MNSAIVILLESDLLNVETYSAHTRESGYPGLLFLPEPHCAGKDVS